MKTTFSHSPAPRPRRELRAAASFLAAALVAATSSSALAANSVSTDAASTCVETKNEPTKKPTARTISSPELVVVQWGSNVWAPLKGLTATEYFTDVLEKYVPTLSADYGLKVGSYGGNNVITPTTYDTSANCHSGICTITTAQVNTEISSQIKNAHLPLTGNVDSQKFSQSMIYLVELPPGYHFPNGSDGSHQDSFHSSMTDPQGNIVPVIYISDMSPGSQGANDLGWTGLGPEEDLFYVITHEILEAAVNPYIGWISGGVAQDNGEVCDICQCDTFYTGVSGLGSAAWTTFTGSYKRWIVPQWWSYSAKACTSMQIATPLAPSSNNSSTFAVARNSDQLDEFYASSSETLASRSWPNGGAGWQSKNVFPSAGIIEGTEVKVVARSASNLDVFWVAPGGAIATASWGTGVGGWTWRYLTGPNSNTGITALGEEAYGLTAVAGSSQDLEVYFVDTTGKLRMLQWSGGNTAWIDAGVLATNIDTGAEVAAVARDVWDRDVFFVGKDGAVYHMSGTSIPSAPAGRRSRSRTRWAPPSRPRR